MGCISCGLLVTLLGARLFVALGCPLGNNRVMITHRAHT